MTFLDEYGYKPDPESLLQMNFAFNFAVNGSEGVSIYFRQKIKIHAHFILNGTLYISYFNSVNQTFSITTEGSTTCAYSDDILNLRFAGNQTSAVTGFMPFSPPIVTDRMYFQAATAGVFRYILYYRLIG